jgi:hypothetical protein
MQYAKHLRSQAARCVRAALVCPDTHFAEELLKIAMDLREEVGRMEASASGARWREAAANQMPRSYSPAYESM